jgi:hypothetical protein
MFRLPGPNVIKLFAAVIYEFLLSARGFVPGKPFQLSLMFVSKAGAYSSGAPVKDSSLRVLEQTGKACQG